MHHRLPGEQADHVIASNVDMEWLESDNKKKSIFVGPVKDFLPDKKTIITVKKTDTIAHAFKTIIDNKVLSLPVYDVQEHSYIGFIDILDIVAHALQVLKETEFIGGEAPRLVESEERFGGQKVSSVSDLSRRNPWRPVEDKMPISAAIDRMVLWKVHRIPVLDSSGELITLITQSQIVSIIHKHMKELGPITHKTVNEMELGLCMGEIVSVPLTALAIDAFKLMHSKGVSAVAVVNEKNELVGNISASDLKQIGYDAKMFSKLYLKIDEFMKHIPPNDVFNGPICVQKTATYEEVVEKLQLAQVHRIYVVGNDKKPIGVISQLEILKALRGANTKKKPTNT